MTWLIILAAASQKGRLWLVAHVLIMYDLYSGTVTDQYGHTALHWASIGGGSTAVGYLLQRGADINAKDNNGDAPVHLAVQGKKWATADILLRKGGNQKAKLTFLLEHGADVNQKNNQGQALIHHLALSGCRKRSLVETVFPQYCVVLLLNTGR